VYLTLKSYNFTYPAFDATSHNLFFLIVLASRS
jgi:hypothetical protein